MEEEKRRFWGLVGEGEVVVDDEDDDRKVKLMSETRRKEKEEALTRDRHECFLKEKGFQKVWK